MKSLQLFLLPACLLALALLMGGCGQKGPLYLPDEEPERSEESAPADETKDDENNEENGR